MPSTDHRRRNRRLIAFICLLSLSGLVSAGMYVYSHPQLMKSLTQKKTTIKTPMQTRAPLTRSLVSGSMCTNILGTTAVGIASSQQSDFAELFCPAPEHIVALNENKGKKPEAANEANQIDEVKDAELVAKVTVNPRSGSVFVGKSSTQYKRQSNTYAKNDSVTRSTAGNSGVNLSGVIPLPTGGVISTDTPSTLVQTNTNNSIANTVLTSTDSGTQDTETLLELSNPSASEVVLENDTNITGLVRNDGIIYIDNDALLTLSGTVTGSGSFVGDVLINGSILPGNSPGLLTFDNVIWNNNNLLFEVESPINRGTTFDGIDVNGDLQLIGDLMINVELWNNPIFNELIDYSFAFVNVVGNLLDSEGNVIQTDPAQNITISDGWLAKWVNTLNGWSLQLKTTQGSESVDAPGSISILLLGVVSVMIMRRKYGANKLQ